MKYKKKFVCIEISKHIGQCVGVSRDWKHKTKQVSANLWSTETRCETKPAD